jgi:hypothetical protein
MRFVPLLFLPVLVGVASGVKIFEWEMVNGTETAALTGDGDLVSYANGAGHVSEPTFPFPVLALPSANSVATIMSSFNLGASLGSTTELLVKKRTKDLL